MIVLTLFLCSVTCSYTDMIPARTMFFKDVETCQSVGSTLKDSMEYADFTCREHKK